MRVLVIDDSSAMAKMLEMRLIRLGMTVSVAADAAGAMKIVERDHPEVVVVDYRIGAPNGELLTRRLREDSPELVIFGYTAYRDSHQAMLGAGADAVFDKDQYLDLEDAIAKLSPR